MIPGGQRRLNEAQMLAHKRQVDAERVAQAILRRRHATRVGMAKVMAAPRKEES